MGTMSEVQCAWKEHKDYLREAFKQQRTSLQFCDVTIVSKDGFVVRCHQAMLAATSGWFRKILKRHRHDHPTIVLDNVPIFHLHAIINYIYIGETLIEQGRMNELLDIAESLEVKGLSGLRRNPAIDKYLAAGPGSRKSNVSQHSAFDSSNVVSNNGNNTDNNNEYDPYTDCMLFKDLPENEDELRTQRITSTQQDTAANSHDASENANTHQYSTLARTAETGPQLQEQNFLTCSINNNAETSIGSSSIDIVGGPLHHHSGASSYTAGSGACYNQSAMTSYHSRMAATTPMQQQQPPPPHQQQQLYSASVLPTCNSKRDFESRMLPPRSAGILEYTNQNSAQEQQSSVDDFRLQSNSIKMSHVGKGLDISSGLGYHHQQQSQEQPHVDEHEIQHSITNAQSQQCLQQQQQQQHHQARLHFSQYLHGNSSQISFPSNSLTTCNTTNNSNILHTNTSVNSFQQQLMKMQQQQNEHQHPSFVFECSSGGSSSINMSSSVGNSINMSNSLYQTAGIDLSLTKSEPSSPRDYTAAVDKRKRSSASLDEEGGAEDEQDERGNCAGTFTSSSNKKSRREDSGVESQQPGGGSSSSSSTSPPHHHYRDVGHLASAAVVAATTTTTSAVAAVAGHA